MLQRTVDELRRLLVHQPHHRHDLSSSTPPPGDCQTPSSHDGVRHSRPSSQSPAAHQAFTPQNVEAVQIPETGSGSVLPPSGPPTEVIMAMTSLPAAILNERFRPQLPARQREKAGSANDWSAVGWQRELLEQRRSGVPLPSNSVAMIPGQCHPSMAAGGGLFLPWIDYASHIPLMAAERLQPAASVAVHRGVVRSFW